jgi:uncharacterized protein (DUF58 family)
VGARTRLQCRWRIVHTAASLARDLLARGHAVGLSSNGVPPGDHARVVLVPAAGREQLNVLLDALARVQSIIIKPLPLLVREHASRVMPFGATVFGISAVPSDVMVQLLAGRRALGTSAVHVGDEPLAEHGDGYGYGYGYGSGHGRSGVARVHWPRIDVPVVASASAPSR